jgi:hypothetical protein
VEIFKPYIDEYGLLLTKNRNGGDSAARMGLLMVLSFGMFRLAKIHFSQWMEIQAFFREAMPKLEVAPGLFIRHPGQSSDCGKPGSRDFACWNDWQAFSRDQWLPLVMGIFLCGNRNRIWYVLKGAKKRHGFLQNGDFLGPAHWGMLLRFTDPVNSRLTLLFCDLFLFLGVIVQSFNKDASNAVNGSAMLIFSNFEHPTFLSKAALWWAKTFDNYQDYYNEYFGNPNDPGAPFNIFAAPILKELFE